MNQTVEEIAAALEADAFGNVRLSVKGAAEPSEAEPDELALAMSPKYASALADGRARAAIVGHDADWQALGLEAAIKVRHPRLAMAALTSLLDEGPEIGLGIHPSAVVDPSAEIGKGAAIGPVVVIGPRARIGPNARIAAHVSIAEDVVVGPDALIHAGVRIGARVRIGKRFVCQPGAVIGGDGFSFVAGESDRVEQVRRSLGTETGAVTSGWSRIHSLGSVEIGDDVEIGANTAVDAGTVNATRIGNRTKVDNLVQVGHNVQIGEDVLMCAHAGVAGSTVVGSRVIIGGKAGITDNVTIGDDVVIGGGAIVLSRVPAGRVLLGYPAMKMDQYIVASRNWRRLPRILKDIEALKKAVSMGGKGE
ncbi:MAG: UDP-3-O-(3-hydroxymyristoyl)glucosamine N-acyltransferase [Boseongicola sp. SB0677_bin_26]|nr:UDP-3-O-(3-hydroxymyristoyl)glucosamine N-acyltransferase [Boseongicola sp. SB0665_bin_10]MYG27309.1 UDP-3-O-(3-hydroxymyristoyl)glucosamine N-acyltransferase [Boseongicola sp. SB0677_bin_26]